MITRSQRPRRSPALAWSCVALVAVGAGTGGASWQAGEAVAASLRAARCEPLQVVDRHGLLLREIRAACGAVPRATWTPHRELPQLLRAAILAGEDRRFEQHAGVDPWAVLRAAYGNARAGRTVSGASTITMQLVRLIRPELRARTLPAKLAQAWLALALETRVSKPEILEAYASLAYFGGGAYGAADAAQRWFGRPLPALSDGELVLLAALPRAPRAYDPAVRPEAARRRRAELVSRLVAHGRLSPAQARAIDAEPLAIVRAPRPAERGAGHFVDWVVAQLPEREHRAGGRLVTTLDRALQLGLERIAREHVAGLEAQGVEHAGAVIVDAESGAVRALVGSRDYAASQIDIVTRRRQLGSLLKPFVYALAIEAGDHPESLALDIGDRPSAYEATGWVGREAGPLTYREALAGSFNLAAVHVLERVGVAKLHARLRLAGVAELPSPPVRYGLPLALGSARVRLLDVVAGYGFLVRDGLVRPAWGIERLERGRKRFEPGVPRDVRVFAPEVSRQVLDILSDPAARHRRFGRGLPLPTYGEPKVAVKTGTASGMADVSAVLATREFLVGAWAGRFDGAATRGMSGMWGAGPLAVRALQLALRGAAPSLPPTAALARAGAPRQPGLPPLPPPELAAWAERARAGVEKRR